MTLKIKHIFTLCIMIAVAILFWNCSSDEFDEDIINGAKTTYVDEDISFGTRVLTTRATNPSWMDYNMSPSNTIIHLWVIDLGVILDDFSSATFYRQRYKNLYYYPDTARRALFLDPIQDPRNPKYPTSGNRVNIYAFKYNSNTNEPDELSASLRKRGHTDSTTIDSTGKSKVTLGYADLPKKTSPWYHKVEETQAGPSISGYNGYYNYYISDMLYGELKMQRHTKDSIVIPFKHAMAKIAVRPSSSMTTFGLMAAAMKIQNVQTCCRFYIDTTTNYQNSLVLETYGSRDTIKTQKAGNDEWVGIVPPQTVPSGTGIINFKYMGETYTYYLTNDLILEGGKKYLFTLYLSKGEIKIKTQVSDWEDVDISTTYPTLNQSATGYVN